MRGLVLPFGPIDPRLKASLKGKARGLHLWDYHRIEHNRLEGMCFAKEFRLEEQENSIQVREP